MPNESPTARSERDTDRQFPAAIRCARRKQAGKIRARRRQHQQSQPRYAIKKSADDVTGVPLKSWMDQPQRHFGVRPRIFLRQLSRDRIQVFRRLLRCHAVIQPANYRQPIRRPVVKEVRLEEIHNGYKVIGPVKLLRAVELRRGHANHRERIFVE